MPASGVRRHSASGRSASSASTSLRKGAENQYVPSAGTSRPNAAAMSRVATSGAYASYTGSSASGSATLAAAPSPRSTHAPMNTGSAGRAARLSSSACTSTPATPLASRRRMRPAARSADHTSPLERGERASLAGPSSTSCRSSLSAGRWPSAANTCTWPGDSPKNALSCRKALRGATDAAAAAMYQSRGVATPAPGPATPSAARRCDATRRSANSCSGDLVEGRPASCVARTTPSSSAPASSTTATRPRAMALCPAPRHSSVLVSISSSSSSSPSLPPSSSSSSPSLAGVAYRSMNDTPLSSCTAASSSPGSSSMSAPSSAVPALAGCAPSATSRRRT
mmetsp:Transcript_6383/g.15850  ORF Transcript_6383/g.15850 Transcript_6383/m.15850 type:complete len:339 (-) Transcript_6383:861-1877(-)